MWKEFERNKDKHTNWKGGKEREVDSHLMERRGGIVGNRKSNRRGGGVEWTTGLQRGTTANTFQQNTRIILEETEI